MLRSTLRNGKITTPSCPDAARYSLRRFSDEVTNINGQLADVTRLARMGEVAYDAWKKKAIKARDLFAEEARQLEAWLAEQPVVEKVETEEDYMAFWRD